MVRRFDYVRMELDSDVGLAGGTAEARRHTSVASEAKPDW
jgi:hypothetical protein